MGLDWIGKWQTFCTARLRLCTMQHNQRAENGHQVGRGGEVPALETRLADSSLSPGPSGPAIKYRPPGQVPRDAHAVLCTLRRVQEQRRMPRRKAV